MSDGMVPADIDPRVNLTDPTHPDYVGDGVGDGDGADPDDPNNLEGKYEWAGTFIAWSAGYTTKPRNGVVELKLHIPWQFRDAAEIVDRLPGVICSFDVGVPIRD